MHLNLDAARVIDAWQCIGCGLVEAPQPCIGVCEDRKVRFAHAADLEAAFARLAEVEARLAVLESLVLRLVRTNPRSDAWEHSFLALQDEARGALAALPVKCASGRGDAAPDAHHPEP